ncbi:uncharacterized protein NECHADRAFT_84379 [Fusarium vanettenii 77-13-4]|uniref:Xylanolytic transcriptional activator regulatory domain-containing protein n=1 Tax=Fusarium vanettenii (strain ATCC MYA-4622 / CBS 123669 / FGSC 9596 / NRRL 45880 / 77-13-4) TaxID=660122 RepID=C7ZCY1_FUSV7|nr:uncharacterized protein NECHADRAFT_84379 [Fusarium vanettenii 77-13-4]EEU37998.1 hypothetical protein NECHADRAFT_84379 [Fusarium vanettenii 77-13-4]
MSDCFTAPCNTIDVYTVQTTTLLAIFDFTAWIKIGMAIRIAQDLQMASEHDATAHPSQKEQFRRYFWSLSLLDRLCSCGCYRPSAILDASCHLRLPSHGEAWRSGQEEQTSTLSKVNTEPCVLSDDALSPFANVIIMGGVLAEAAQYMLQDMDARAHYPPWDVNSDFTSIQSGLVFLETQLQVRRLLADTVNPSSSADNTVNQAAVSHDIYAQILFHLCNCLLNHPFLLRRRLEIVKCAGPLSFLHRCFKLAWTHAQQLC